MFFGGVLKFQIEDNYVHIKQRNVLKAMGKY